jgi:hypothetical protein
MMTLRKRRWLAGSLGTGLTLLLLLIAYLDTLGDPSRPERLVLTDVTTYEPPPPPPPPPRPREARSGGSTGAFLPLDTSRAPVLNVMQLDVQFAARVGELNLGGLGQGIGVGSGDGTGDGTGTGFGLAQLSELDQVPVVVSAPVLTYPDEAVQRGIAAFDLEFDIVIDEEGRTYPIAIVVNPFPSLNSQFLQWASRVRFSPPTRLGIPVRTEYRWPVRIKR